jgi:hypothetical protein
MNKVIYDNMTRPMMIRWIHLECDTSSFCYKMDDEELIATFKKIFKVV